MGGSIEILDWDEIIKETYAIQGELHQDWEYIDLEWLKSMYSGFTSTSTHSRTTTRTRRRMHMNTSSNGRVDRVRRPTLALNNDNNLNGTHDFNDLCLDDYGIYVFT